MKRNNTGMLSQKTILVSVRLDDIDREWHLPDRVDALDEIEHLTRKFGGPLELKRRDE